MVSLVRSIDGYKPSFLQGKLLVARPGCRNGKILKDAAAVDDIFFQRRQRDRQLGRHGYYLSLHNASAGQTDY